MAQAWGTPYSIMHNPISDLGNTACGVYADRYVCSPFDYVMNTSFVALGGFMTLGSLLIFQGFKKTFGSFVGFTLMGIAGAGTVMVGLFPENVNGFLHGFGAFMPFFFGNLALVILGRTLDLPKSLKYYTQFSGFFALACLALFGTKTYLGLGEGGMERLVAYPQTLWLIVFGAYISTHRYGQKTH